MWSRGNFKSEGRDSQGLEVSIQNLFKGKETLPVSFQMEELLARTINETMKMTDGNLEKISEKY